MPQEFHVLQCSRCRTFQVQQVKKAKKWACKMCGEKQSVLRVYGRGTGAECRQHVQKLNSLRGELEDKEQLVSATRAEDSADHLVNFQIDECEVEHDIQRTRTKDSKWSQYIELVSANHVDEEDDENSTYTTDWGRYNTNIRQHRKQKRMAYKQKAQIIDQTTNDETPWIDVNFKPVKIQGPSMKRPPENCLSTRAVKRTKWAAYEDLEKNCENYFNQSHTIPLTSKPTISTNQQASVHFREAESANRNSTPNVSANQNFTANVSANQNFTANVSANQNFTANISANQNSAINVSANQHPGTDISSNPQSVTINSARSKDLVHKSYENTIPEVNFTLCDMDDLLEDKADEPVKQKENFSASKKPADEKIGKRSKWDVYLSQSSDEETPDDNKGTNSTLVGIQALGKFPSEFEQHETRGSKPCSSNEFKETAHDMSSVYRHSKNVKSQNQIISESSCDSEIILPSSGVESECCLYDESGVVQPKMDSEVIKKQSPKDKNIIGREQLFKYESPGKERISRPVFELEDLDDADFEFSVY